MPPVWGQSTLKKTAKSGEFLKILAGAPLPRQAPVVKIFRASFESNLARSSVVERSAVNRLVAGSSPAGPGFSFVSFEPVANSVAAGFCFFKESFIQLVYRSPR